MSLETWLLFSGAALVVILIPGPLSLLMKGEVMRTVPKADAPVYKKWRVTNSTDWDAYKMNSESEGPAKYWHRKIDVEKTLKQFDERFDFNALNELIGTPEMLARGKRYAGDADTPAPRKEHAR